MRRDAEKPADKGESRGGERVLVIATIVACGAALARWADGAAMLPMWACAALQLPAVGLWIARVCGRARSPLLESSGTQRHGESHGQTEFAHATPAGGRWRLDLILTKVVMVAGGVAAFRRSSIDPFLTAGTVFVAGQLLFEQGARLFAAVESRIEAPMRLIGYLMGRWFVLLLVVTVVSALPIATRSAVPDYRHNFWQHVVNSAFTATSAGSLVGATIYSFRDDYSRVGQVVILLTTHLAGVSFAAVGLSIIQPFLRRPVGLRMVVRWMYILIGVGVLTTAHAWTSEETPSLLARLGWSFVYVSDAMFNTGFVMRPDGLARHLKHGTVFVTISGLAIVGSMGLPVVIDLIRGSKKRTAETSDSAKERERGTARPVAAHPWRVLPAYEAGACFWLLIVGAFLLWLFETPGFLADRALQERPFDLGQNIVALRDPMSHQARWSIAMFVSAALRSAGIQSIPLVPGVISMPGYDVLIVWMAIGGSIAGMAGGMRTSTLILFAICLFTRRASWGHITDGLVLRRSVLKALLIGVAGWAGAGGVLLFTLAGLTQASTYEWLIDGTAAYCGVSLSSGAAVHLTALGRLTMIVMMIAGCMLPLLCWSSISSLLRWAALHSAKDAGDRG